MSSALVPALEVPREEVAAYLVAQGHAPQIVQWKYFDDGFNEGRNRGWAWQKDGRVAGFIGVLPFHVERGSRRVEARWLCDWSIEDFAAHPGAGVRLFKRALQSGLHFVLGGNANSLAPMEKMASRTQHGADVELRLFLRVGAVLERLAQRLPAASFAARTPLSQVPLPRPRFTGSSAEVSVEEGVSSSLAPLLESASDSDSSWSASYDLKYLQWQIGRCPILRSWTVADADARSALSLWHPVSSPRAWRAILWGQPGELGALRVLNEGIAHALARGAHELSILASRSDIAQHDLLKTCGFTPTRAARPLFVFDGPQPEAQLDDLRGLNFLSADLSYRF